MQTQDLKPNTTTETDSAPDESRLPVNAAPEGNGLPDDRTGESLDQGNSESSWDDINSKLEGNDQPDAKSQPKSIEEQLREELALERQKLATEEKRRKDAQKAFKERSEELKRMKEEAEAQSKKAEDTQKLQDDMASGNIAAPESDADWDSFATEYGLTEEEKEIFELNPEMRTGLEKILLKRLDSGLSEREQKAKEAETQKLEAEINRQQEEEWMNAVKQTHPEADKLVESQEFQVWIGANEALRAGILSGKEQYDPSGLVEILDHYNAYQEDRKRIQSKRNFGRQASVSHPSVANVGGQEEDSWKSINAKLERERSR